MIFRNRYGIIDKRIIDMILYRLQRGYYGREKGFKIGSETSAGVSGVPEKYAGKCPCPYFRHGAGQRSGNGRGAGSQGPRYVSDGGRPKIGYLRETLIDDIEQFLGYDNTTDAVLIGAGKLGQALMGYSGFDEYGLNILAAFDASPKAEKTEEGKPIYHISQLTHFCRTHKVLMGIITVPAEAAQQVADQLIAGGIKGIWNFAPTHLDVPPNILVQYENMATSLAVLSVHLQAQIKEEKEVRK